MIDSAAAVQLQLSFSVRSASRYLYTHDLDHGHRSQSSHNEIRVCLCPHNSQAIGLRASPAAIMTRALAEPRSSAYSALQMPPSTSPWRCWAFFWLQDDSVASGFSSLLCVPTSQGPPPLSWPLFPPLSTACLVSSLCISPCLIPPSQLHATPVYVCKPRSTDHQTLPMQGSLTGRLVPSSLPSCSATPCLRFRLANSRHAGSWLKRTI